MDKIGVLGAFGFSALDETTGGQPVKTRTLYYALCERYGNSNVLYVETYKWKNNPVRMFYQLIRMIRECSTLIMLPAQNGISVFLPFLLRIKHKNAKLFYDVVGGWIADKAMRNKRLVKQLNQLDGIWVETSSMKNDLAKMGINNVEVIPNFKKINVLKNDEVKQTLHEPYKLCTFSRVMEEKGITNAINTVKRINDYEAKKVYSLDIYGPIDESYRAKFSTLLLESKDYVEYKGVINPEASVETLRNYDVLLFPTEFYTEGIPGTIIDAYSAGVPVMTSLWSNSSDVFWEGETGWGYQFEDKEGLFKLLWGFARNPVDFLSMRLKCIEKADLFSSEKAISRIASIIENG